MKKLILAAVAILIAQNVRSQCGGCTYYDDFSNALLWHNTTPNLNVSGFALNFNATPNSPGNFVYRSISGLKVSPDLCGIAPSSLSYNSNWSVDFAFTPTTYTPATGGSAYNILAFSDQNIDINTPATTQEYFALQYSTAAGYGTFNIAYYNTSSWTFSSSAFYTNVPGTGSTIYVRMEFLVTGVLVNMYSDACHSAFLCSYFFDLNELSLPYFPNTFKYIQSGAVSPSGSGSLSATINTLSFALSPAYEYFDPFTAIGTWSVTPCIHKVTVNTSAGVWAISHVISAGQDDERVYNPLPMGILDNSSWVSEFEYYPTYMAVGNNAGVGHELIDFTSSSDNYIDVVSGCSLGIGYTANNVIGVELLSSPFTITGSCTQKYYIIPVTKLGSSIRNITPAFTGVCVQPPTGTGIEIDPILDLHKVFYIRLERLSKTTGKLSVFSDAGRTQNWPGSPICFSIDQNITSLGYVQSGSILQGGLTRNMSGLIRNLYVNNCTKNFDYDLVAWNKYSFTPITTYSSSPPYSGPITSPSTLGGSWYFTINSTATNYCATPSYTWSNLPSWTSPDYQSNPGPTSLYYNIPGTPPQTVTVSAGYGGDYCPVSPISSSFNYTPLTYKKGKEFNNYITDSSCAVYPNPVNNELFVYFPFNKLHALVSIYSIDGKHLREIEINSNKTVINTNNLTSGIYIVRLKSDFELRQWKIEVVHPTH